MSCWFNKFADDISKEFIDVLSDPELLIKQGQVIKDDRSTTVVRFQWQEQFYILKRFNARNKVHTVKRFFRQSRAINCWKMSNTFSRFGVSVAKPIAMLEKRIGFIKLNSYFVCQEVDGVELLDWLPKQSLQTQSLVRKELSKIFISFENNRLSHGDMKATNLLWTEKSEKRIVTIDLDTAKQHSIDLLFKRAHARDKRRFSRNGPIFADMLQTNETP